MTNSSQITEQKAGTSVSNELTKERNREAAERTLMAWLRTSISLIGFGFGIDQIVQALSQGPLGLRPNLNLAVRIVGISMIALGTFAMLAATKLHTDELAHIESEASYTYRPRWSLGTFVGRLVALIGLVAFLAILIGSLVSLALGI